MVSAILKSCLISICKFQQKGEYTSLHLLEQLFLAHRAVSFDVDDLDGAYCGIFQVLESQTVVYPSIVTTMRAFEVTEEETQEKNDNEKHLSEYLVKGTGIYCVTL